MGRIVHPQSALNPEAHVLEQALERNKSVAKAQTDAEAQAGYVRAAQNPGVMSPQRMRPEIAFAWIERDIERANENLRAVDIGHFVDGEEPGAKLRLIDLQLLSTPLKPGLSLDDARVDGLDAITAGHRFPRADAMSLEDDIGIEEDRA